MFYQQAYLRPRTRAIYPIAVALLMLNLAITDVPAIRAATFWYVAPTGSDANTCLSRAAACQAISTAIDRSADGDTIILDAGTYSETLTITKSLTITGAGADTTAIDSHYSDRVLTIQAPAEVKINGVYIQ